MKYFKHTEAVGGVYQTKYFHPEGTETFIPEAEGNSDYIRMMEAVEAGEAEIEEVDDTPVPTWQDNRIAAYGSWGEQLDMMYHGTWEDHVAAVKAAHPKP
jgi:hypothetical protein